MKLLLYCTKAKPYLYGMYSGFESRYGYHTTNDKNVFKEHSILNGKIVAECDFEVEEIRFSFNEGEELKKNNGWRNYHYAIDGLKYGEFYEKSCLSFGMLDDYFDMPQENGKVGYAVHIKNLHIFDEPKELSEYGTWVQPLFLNEVALERLQKAPQNMMKCYDFEKDYILISIRPEWLCKILNGEKTIEIRKRVLKEMLK